MKLNRFLIAEDPRKDGSLAIVHTIDPIAIIGLINERVHHIKPFRLYSYINSDGVNENWTLYVHHLFTTNMNNLDDFESEKTIESLLNRAWHWYKAYMQWEDENLDTEDYANRN